MKTHQPILTLTISATADLPPMRFIGLDGALCADGATSPGVTAMAVDAGEQAGVHALGVVLVEAGAAMAAGGNVVSDAEGRAIYGTGAPQGLLLDAATAPGDVVRVLRGI